MSYVPIQVVENRQGIMPGVYLATKVINDGTSYILENGPDQDREVYRSNVMTLSPQGFVKAIKDKQQEEIQRLQQEVDDLRAPVKLPGDVYDSLELIVGVYGTSAFAKIMECCYLINRQYDQYLEDSFQVVSRWYFDHEHEFYLMMAHGRERAETPKEKWVRNMMDLMNDPHIDQKQFLAGVYEQYKVAEILESLEADKQG